MMEACWRINLPVGTKFNLVKLAIRKGMASGVPPGALSRGVIAAPSFLCDGTNTSSMPKVGRSFAFAGDNCVTEGRTTIIEEITGGPDVYTLMTRTSIYRLRILS